MIHLEGPGGTGKTSMLYALSGIIFNEPCYYGSILFNDYPPSDYTHPGYFVYVSGIPGAGLLNATVQEELERGCNSINLSAGERVYRIDAITKALHIYHLLNRNPSELSGGEQKLVELAAAFCMNPSVLLLDEPFANLSPSAADALTELIRAYNQNGTTILIAEHFLPPALKSCARTLSLEASVPATDSKVGIDLLQPKFEETKHMPYITASDIRHPYISDAQTAINMDIKEAGVLQITGPNGSGKTTLLRILAGLEEHSGRLHISGRPMDSSNKLINWKVQAAYIGTALQNPESQFFKASVKDELFFAGTCDHRFIEYISAILGLTPLMEHSPFTLSLGEQKRLQLALALQHQPAILLLDEPDAGLDVYYVSVVAELLQSFTDMIIVYTSHNDTFSSLLKGSELQVGINEKEAMFL